MWRMRAALGRPLTGPAFDGRLAQVVGTLGGTAVLPLAVRALFRQAEGRTEIAVGLGLAGLVALLCMALGWLARQSAGRGPVSSRSMWPEFASYPACLGLMVGGTWWVAGLGVAPARVTLGLLATSAVSLGVLVLGMASTRVRALAGPGR